jgi:stage III sporulation protein SpoIIIAA
MEVKNNLEKILNIFPDRIKSILISHPEKSKLIEIIIDLGKIPQARFFSHYEYISTKPINNLEIAKILNSLSKFNSDNRTGIDKTFHRISCIRNKEGIIIGLTCRIGRNICGGITIIRDLLETKKSILFLGQPGSGKTTIIREISNILSSENDRRVIIIDNANEIGGGNDITHNGIGYSRRMQVERNKLPEKTMIEAVENHTPEVIIIDEIGTEKEAETTQTIAERGIQLIATAHGYFLLNLLKNPTLSQLVGGLEYVTLGDEEAKKRNSKKTIIERKGLCTFQIIIELKANNFWVIYENSELAIDRILKGTNPRFQIRNFYTKKQVKIISNSLNSKYEKKLTEKKNQKDISCIYIFSYSISKYLIKNYFKNYKLIFTNKISEADILICLNQHNTKIKELIDYKKIIIIKSQNKNSLKAKIQIFQKLNTKILEKFNYLMT